MSFFSYYGMYIAVLNARMLSSTYCVFLYFHEATKMRFNPQTYQSLTPFELARNFKFLGSSLLKSRLRSDTSTFQVVCHPGALYNAKLRELSLNDSLASRCFSVANPTVPCVTTFTFEVLVPKEPLCRLIVPCYNIVYIFPESRRFPGPQVNRISNNSPALQNTTTRSRRDYPPFLVSYIVRTMALLISEIDICPSSQQQPQWHQ